MSEERVSAQGVKFKLPRWAWVLVIVSVALNLLVAGAAVGSLWAHRHWGHHGHKAFFRSLPEERRKELKALMRESKKQSRALWRDVRDVRRDVADVMRAEPFDEAKLRAALETLRSGERKARAAGEESVIRIMKELSPEERQWFARFIERRHMRRHRFKGRGGPGFF